MIRRWLRAGHRVLWTHQVRALQAADFCFYLSLSTIVPANIRAMFRHNLVVHESDLLHGKGWSPLTWQILEGKNEIPVTLIEAEDKVDSGVIYAQEWIECAGHELIDELRQMQAETTLKLCEYFVSSYPEILGQARIQVGEESFHPRRREADSELNPVQTLDAQFNLLRVVDNQRYPAFFNLRGQGYFLRIDRAKAWEHA
jgi:methionyl-tRNA formyltransferase